MCQSLDPELEAELGRIRDTAPKYGVWTKIKVFTLVANNFCLNWTVEFSDH